MTSWRMDLTVLADLSASMFAACFVLLLIFLSLEQEPPEVDAPVMAFVQPVLSPEETVRLLHAHGAAPDGVSLDLFADRVALRIGEVRAVLRGNVAAGLGRALPAGVPQVGVPVRLYVFSHSLYGDVATALRRQSVSHVEIDVPLALRDADAPQHAWNREFVRLGESDLTLPAFREALATLLDGRTRHAGREGGGAEAGSPMEAGSGEAPGLAARLRQWLVTFATIAFPLSGLMAVLWIEAGSTRPRDGRRREAGSAAPV